MASREDDNGAQTPTGKVTPPPRTVTAVTTTRATGGGRTPPPPDPPDPPGDDEDGMLRMSFLDHLTELRSRIIKMIFGIIVAFSLSLFYCEKLWRLIAQPAVIALKNLGVNPPTLKAITPMEQFNVI